jgi:hypothetical protein
VVCAFLQQVRSGNRTGVEVGTLWQGLALLKNMRTAELHPELPRNCGAVEANDEVALSIAESMRATPENYKRKWLDEQVGWLKTDDEASAEVSKH